MPNLSTYSQLAPCKILVAGDLLLDTYTIGKARRISPEAPVAVVLVQNQEHRAGGAGNVVLNLVSMSAIPVILSRVGDDEEGERLLSALIAEGVSVEAIFKESSYPTPVKNRVIADQQQIVRVDREQVMPLSKALEEKIIASLPHLLEGVQLVAISDYGKGFLTDAILHALITESSKRQIPVIADPKGIDFAKYRGATLIKPNLGEAYAATKTPYGGCLDRVANELFRITDAKHLMITRSEAGIALFSKESGRQDFPVEAREVKDVTGAGDTVLAMLSCAIANGLSLDVAANLCNAAAGIAIQRLGCARITLGDLAERLIVGDVANKVFDHPSRMFVLKELLSKSPYSLLSLDGHTTFSSALFRQLKELKKQNDQKVVIFIENSPDSKDLIELLSELHEVDFILTSKDCYTTLVQDNLLESVANN